MNKIKPTRITDEWVVSNNRYLYLILIDNEVISYCKSKRDAEDFIQSMGLVLEKELKEKADQARNIKYTKTSELGTESEIGKVMIFEQPLGYIYNGSPIVKHVITYQKCYKSYFYPASEMKDSVRVEKTSVGEQQIEVGEQQIEVGGPETEVQGPETEVQGPETEVQGTQTEVQGTQTEVQGTQTEMKRNLIKKVNFESKSEEKEDVIIKVQISGVKGETLKPNENYNPNKRKPTSKSYQKKVNSFNNKNLVNSDNDFKKDNILQRFLNFLENN